MRYRCKECKAERLGLKQLLSILVLLTSSWKCVADAESTTEKALLIGVVPQFNTLQIQDIWIPIIDAVGDLAETRLSLQASPDIPTFEQQFATGVFDLAYMNPYHAIKAESSQGYLPILRDTQSTLIGIIVVRSDSTISGLPELDRKQIAMPSANALGAALMPRAFLDREIGVHPVYKYVKSHDSVYLNVALGKADAGGGILSTYQVQNRDIRGKLKLLHQFQAVPTHPIVAHPRLGNNLISRLQKAFIEFSTTDEGQRLLSAIPIHSLGPTSKTEYNGLKAMKLEQYYEVDRTHR